MMDALALRSEFTIAPMSPDAIALAFDIQAADALQRQAPIRVRHVLHAGVYSRTILVPAGIRIVGALIKIPTQVIVAGAADVWLGEWRRISGYCVLPASAGRKQIFEAIADTYITMVFASDARSVEEAEDEFTDEAYNLTTRHGDGVVETIITGE